MQDSHLLGTPNELQLKILSSVSAKDIQRFRRTCKHFRDLIDDPSNLSSLVSDTIDKNIKRLQESVDYAVNYDGLDLLEAFSRFLRLRGSWCSEGDDWEDQGIFMVFAINYVHQQPALRLQTDHDVLHYHMRFHSIVDLVKALYRVHMEVVHSDGNSDSIIDISHRKQTFLRNLIGTRSLLEGWGLEVDVEAYYDKIVAGHTMTSGASQARRPLPKYLVTELAELNGWSGPFFKPGQEVFAKGGLGEVGRAGHDAVCATFGVPSLPAWAQGGFAYCVIGFPTCRLVFNSISSGSVLPLVRAAVLEEMYLY